MLDFVGHCVIVVAVVTTNNNKAAQTVSAPNTTEMPTTEAPSAAPTAIVLPFVVDDAQKMHNF